MDVAAGVDDEVRPAAPAASREFTAWVEPHLSLLRALAIREVGDHRADDAVQEALVRAWRRRASYRPERGSARSWLVAILFDQCRRLRVRTRPASPVTGAGSAADHSGLVDRRIDVDAAISVLPPRQRQLVTLFYLADLDIGEIAVVLGIRPGTVKSGLFDARAALHRLLEGHGHG